MDFIPLTNVKEKNTKNENETDSDICDENNSNDGNLNDNNTTDGIDDTHGVPDKGKSSKQLKYEEKMKNRLFVKMKKPIYSENQIKELHPDIKQVIFPRKKRSK